MPLTEEEWRAFINEFGGAMTDVEADLFTALEGDRLGLASFVDQGRVSLLEADGLLETIREPLLRAQERLNRLVRRLNQMRMDGEL